MLIAYRDYIATAQIYNGASDFESSAPLTNAQDRRLAVATIGAIDFEDENSDGVNPGFDFGEEKTIDVIGMLGHNLPSGKITVTINIFDNADVPTQISDIALWAPAEDSQFPRNYLKILEQPLTNVRKILFSIAVASGQTFSPAFRPIIGRFWAGPAWRPTGKTARRNYRMQSRDNSVVEESNGQQVYVDYKPRFRQLTCTIPVLSEADAIGTDDGLTPNLQDIAFECGRGGEVIVIPSTSSNQVVHKFGVYGHFLEPPPVDLIGEAAGRKYESTFDVVETL